MTYSNGYIPIISNLNSFQNDPNGSQRTYIQVSELMASILPLFNVKDYGAMGDGIANDTAAIRSAIFAAYSAGGGTVYFPRGTYLVHTEGMVTYLGYSMVIELLPNVHIRGESLELSIIKMADNQLPYQSIIGHNFANALNGMEISDLTFDANFTNNVHDGSDILTYYRLILFLFNGKRMRVHHCRFTNFDNLNCVSINGTAVENVHLTDCIFDNYGFTTTWHDASTIYFDANNYVISGNYFEGNAGAAGVGTAIETHGSNQIITNNILKNVLIGINLTGISSSNYNIVVANNTMLNVRWGISIYSQTVYGSTMGLTNAVIANNTVVNDLDMWYTRGGNTPNTLYGSGITLGGSWDLPVVNLTIANNNILLKPFTSPTQLSDNAGSGIHLYDPLPNNAQHQSIKIIGNTVDGALSAGIWIGMDVVDLEIANNTLRNTGQAANINAGYKLGMYIGGTSIRAGRIHDNLIIDTQNPETIQFGYGLYTTTIIDSIFANNQVHCVNGAFGEFYGTASLTAAWLLDTYVATWAVPFGYYKIGSRVFAKDTGLVHTQTSATSTMSWT